MGVGEVCQFPSGAKERFYVCGLAFNDGDDSVDVLALLVNRVGEEFERLRQGFVALGELFEFFFYGHLHLSSNRAARGGSNTPAGSRKGGAA